MQLGIDVLLGSQKLQSQLQGKKVALLAHPASVTKDLTHSLEALCTRTKIKVTAALGPQHGIRGDKQYNMIETYDDVDEKTGLPVFSLYGHTRRITPEMFKHFDCLLVDLQDVGCRIYTYVATLFYALEDCAKHKKEIWILDRPNPCGRPVEGTLLLPEWQSFVGSIPILMQHGLTLGELANWIVKNHNLDLNYKVVSMEKYNPTEGPGFGWPVKELSWVNPSPNIPTLDTARVFCGTVLLEGTEISEARGTTRPLQYFGAPNLRAAEVFKEMQKLKPEWMKGCVLREAYFEPISNKFKEQLCSGFQLHADEAVYDPSSIKPTRLMYLFFKVLKRLQPELMLWARMPYEYEKDRLPIDLLNGGPALREWVDDDRANFDDLEAMLKQDEKKWFQNRREFLLYPDFGKEFYKDLG